MSRTLRACLVALVLLLVTGCSFRGLDDLPLPGAPDVGDDSYVVHAEFDNVLNLAPRSTIRRDGVVIGRVESITRAGWKARVELRLRRDARLPANVGFRISQTSLLGEKYVAVQDPVRPASGSLAAGAVVASRDTSRGREVEEVLGALALLLNGGGLAQLRTITVELRDALGGDGAMRGFVGELDELVTTLDRNRKVILSSLEHVNTLSRTLAREHAAVGRAVVSIDKAVTTLVSQRTRIVAMLRHLDAFSTVASDVVRRTGSDLVADLRALEPVLAQLERAGDDLPRAIEAVLSFPFPDEVLDAIEGDYVNLDVLMDLSPLVIAGNLQGGSAGTATPGAGIPSITQLIEQLGATGGRQ